MIIGQRPFTFKPDLVGHILVFRKGRFYAVGEVVIFIDLESTVYDLAKFRQAAFFSGVADDEPVIWIYFVLYLLHFGG